VPKKDALGGKWREGGQSACTILGGRVGTLRSPLLAESGDESVPYPFLSQMAKVELRNCLKRGPSDAPGVHLARVSRPKRAERDGLGASGASVPGTSGTFQTVSQANFLERRLAELLRITLPRTPLNRDHEAT
jgi:hypothetical protein